MCKSRITLSMQPFAVDWPKFFIHAQLCANGRLRLTLRQLSVSIPGHNDTTPIEGKAFGRGHVQYVSLKSQSQRIRYRMLAEPGLTTGWCWASILVGYHE